MAGRFILAEEIEVRSLSVHPKKEIEEKCVIVTSKEIIKIIRNT